MGQGRENARTFLKENTDICKKLESALRKKMEIPGLGNNAAAAAAPNGATNGTANGSTNGVAAEKPPVKPAAAAATAGAGDTKGRPSAR